MLLDVACGETSERPGGKRYRGDAVEGTLGTNPGQRTQLPALTGLRFLAALFVVLYHVAIAGGPAPLACVYLGYAGVSFFFILSGFILTYTYIAPGGEPCATPAEFWGARVARICPIYFVALAIGICPYLWYHDPRATPLLTGLGAMTFTQAWLPWSADAWNGPGWSLSAEVFFYALFPYLAPRVARLSRRRLNLAANLLWATGISAAVTYIVINPDHLSTWGTADTTWVRVLRFNPLVRLPEFLLGITLGRMFVLDRAEAKLTTLRGWACSLAVLGVLAAIVLAPISGFPLPAVLVNDGMLDPLFAVLIYSLAWGQGLVARLFALPLLVMLGEASYALYLLHVPVRLYLSRVLAAPNPGTAWWTGYWAGYLCICLGLSVAAYRWIERPARRGVRRAFEHRSARPGISTGGLALELPA